jgi:hypothetical protein
MESLISLIFLDFAVPPLADTPIVPLLCIRMLLAIFSVALLWELALDHIANNQPWWPHQEPIGGNATI